MNFNMEEAIEVLERNHKHWSIFYLGYLINGCNAMKKKEPGMLLKWLNTS
jgi:arginyl-tRNA--protein-N-Asp/Glu arginylyltransferase